MTSKKLNRDCKKEDTPARIHSGGHSSRPEGSAERELPQGNGARADWWTPGVQTGRQGVEEWHTAPQLTEDAAPTLGPEVRQALPAPEGAGPPRAPPGQDVLLPLSAEPVLRVWGQESGLGRGPRSCEETHSIRPGTENRSRKRRGACSCR